MKSWYEIRARASGTELLIYDEIGAYGVSAKGFLAELGALPDGAPIDLRLNSPGGSVFDAVAIFNALQCAFRSIRSAVPTTFGQSFRGNRSAEDRCRVGMALMSGAVAFVNVFGGVARSAQ